MFKPQLEPIWKRQGSNSLNKGARDLATADLGDTYAPPVQVEPRSLGQVRRHAGCACANAGAQVVPRRSLWPALFCRAGPYFGALVLPRAALLLALRLAAS